MDVAAWLHGLGLQQYEQAREYRTTSATTTFGLLQSHRDIGRMSGDPEQEYFADGMVEEIITALSRIKWLFVIARNLSFSYKGQAVERAAGLLSP